MEKKRETTLLASFATIKALSDAKKYQSPYQILGEFIRNIIVEDCIYTFQATEIKNRLKSRFGFDVPEAVVKTSLRRIAGITVAGGIYSVSKTELGLDSLFREKNKEADDTNNTIFKMLAEYVKSRENKSVDIEALTQDLIAFLVDENLSVQGRYTDYISEFVLKSEKNSSVQEGFAKIREGSILFIGLSHRISETGSISKPLTLYLGTEILFSLVGYNGEIYSQLAKDFFRLVQSANAGSQKTIVLRYFPDVKKEIEDYFFAAENVVEGKTRTYFRKPAMNAITNGCSTSADVRVRKADFFTKLQFQFGIIEDSDNYYDESLFESNLESIDYVDEDDKEKKKELAIKFVSHINKLRGCDNCWNELESCFLLVTNSKTTLQISKEQTEEKKKAEGKEYLPDFAVSLDRITSLLWYKLGNGFGNGDYPVSVNAVLKARVVLSSSIAKNAENAFSDTKKQYSDGIITEEQLAARIITLRQKPILPEELQSDNIAEIMDFSPEFLSRFEEQVNSDRKALEEKEGLIESISKEKDSVISAQKAEIQDKEETIALARKKQAESDSTIAQQEAVIAVQAKENEQLQKELNDYRAKEAEEARRKIHQKAISRRIGKVALIVVVAIVVYAVSVLICTHINPNLTNAISIAIGILGLIVACISWFNDTKKEKETTKQREDTRSM